MIIIRDSMGFPAASADPSPSITKNPHASALAQSVPPSSASSNNPTYSPTHRLSPGHPQSSRDNPNPDGGWPASGFNTPPATAVEQEARARMQQQEKERLAREALESKKLELVSQAAGEGGGGLSPGEVHMRRFLQF